MQHPSSLTASSSNEHQRRLDYQTFMAEFCGSSIFVADVFEESEMSRSTHIAVSAKKGCFKHKSNESHSRQGKFKKQKCELCEKPATCQCTGCKVTFYCCKEHQATDWAGIHEEFCSDLRRLRSDLPSGTRDMDIRARRVEETYRLLLKEHLRVVAVERCRRFLLDEEWDKSVPAALQYLRLLLDLRGPDCPDIISVFIMLAEASTGMQKFDRAMEYLQQADWIASELGRISDETRALFFRAVGLLNFAQGNTEAARVHFLHQIHYALQHGGPGDILMANGHFQLAMVLVEEGKMPEAVKYFRRAIKPWMLFMENMCALHLVPSNRHKPLSDLTLLHENEERELLKMMQIILDMSATHPGAFRANELALVYYTLSMLHLTKRDFTLMVEYGAKALREADEITDRVRAIKIHIYVEKSNVIADDQSDDNESTGTGESLVFYDAESTISACIQEQIKERQDLERRNMLGKHIIDQQQLLEEEQEILQQLEDEGEEEEEEAIQVIEQEEEQISEELIEQQQQKEREQPQQQEEVLQEREQEKVQEQAQQDMEYLQEQEQEKVQEQPPKGGEEGEKSRA